MPLAEPVDYVTSVDPDKDRITTAVVYSRTQDEITSRIFTTTARDYSQALR